MAKMIQVTLKRSTIGCTKRQKACVRGLGLRRMHHTTQVIDTPENRGMIEKMRPFLQIQENV